MRGCSTTRLRNWSSPPPDKSGSIGRGYCDRMRTNAQQFGDAAEQFVADRLTAAGWSTLGRNVHVGRHELDLVAIDPGPPAMLVVVEIRWRGGRSFGLPEETVGNRKRLRIRAAAYGLLERGAFPDGSRVPYLPLRFDLVVVEPGDRIRHHRHAM